MKAKIFLALCLTMMVVAQARGQLCDSPFEGADKITVANGPVVISGDGLTARSLVSITAYYDKDHKNFIGFMLAITVEYNSGPGMSECFWFKEKVFKKVVPVDGKVRLKFTARGNCTDGLCSYDILKAEGKMMEVTAKVTFDCKKYIETGNKSMKKSDMPKDRSGNVDWQKLYRTIGIHGMKSKQRLRVVKADAK